MKKIIYFVLYLSSMSFCLAETTITSKHKHQMDMIAKTTENATRITTIAVLIYPQMVLQDFAGPIEVFSKAKKLTKGKYRVFTVSFDEKMILTENNFVKITPDYTINNMPPADYLILPGASMPVIDSLQKSSILKNFILNWDKNKKGTTVSICTASYLLANTNALNNQRATTHYFVADDFSKQFPDVELVKNVRFVDEGNYITSSGVTSGIDVALHIVGKISGNNIKNMISRALQYDYHEVKQWPIAPNGMKFER